MTKVSRDEIKNKGFKGFLKKFKYSAQGLAHAYKNEQGMWLHAAGTVLAVILGIIFKLSLIEWAMVAIALGVILASELINTAIEATVDLCTLEIHPLAKIAKDCASAATFVLTIVSIIIFLCVFVPHFI